MEILTRDVMTHPVVTIPEEATIDDLLHLLQDQNISGVPVVDATQHLVGVIAVTDVVALGCQENAEGQHAFESDFHTSPAMDGLSSAHHLLKPHANTHGRRVNELMSRTFIATHPDTPISELAGQMLDHRIHRILVQEDRQAIGIVSLTDILRALRKSAPQPA